MPAPKVRLGELSAEWDDDANKWIGELAPAINSYLVLYPPRDSYDPQPPSVQLIHILKHWPGMIALEPLPRIPGVTSLPDGASL